MKYHSSKPKPETGMELTVTLSMPAGQDTQQSAAALILFMDGVSRLAGETGAAWIKLNCAGIPEELESKIAGALSSLKRPRLELVINNVSRS